MVTIGQEPEKRAGNGFETVERLYQLPDMTMGVGDPRVALSCSQ